MGGRANFGDAFAGFSSHFGLINDNQLTARVAFMLDFESQTTQTGDKLPGYPDGVSPPIQSGGVAIDISDEMMDWAPPDHRSPTIVSLLRPDRSSPSD